MKKESYIKMLEYVSSRGMLLKFVIKGGRALSFVSYIWYPVLLFCVFYMGQPEGWKAVVVPAVGFLILSVFRKWLNAPRPYEVFGVKPVIVKETKGNSFPSRHVFSAFIIAFTTSCYYPAVGFALAICGSLLAVTRVLGGVHFIKDVVAGAISGIGLGLAGFLLL